MTLTETLVAGSLLLVLLLVVALAMTSSRTELKRKQTLDLLATLDAAVTAYHDVTHQWPTVASPAGADAATEKEPRGRERPPPRASAERETDATDLDSQLGVTRTEPPSPPPQRTAGAGQREPETDAVLSLLWNVPASRAVLETVPAILRVPVTAGDASSTRAPTSAPAGGWTVQDSWGHPLRCLTTASRLRMDRDAVTANGGRPIFVSPSEDGDFDSPDNLRSDELAG